MMTTFRTLTLLTLMLAICALPTVAQKGKPPRGAEFEAALVRCGDVTQPAALVNCGTDPLTVGEATIKKTGHVQVKLVGAQPSVTYNVVYRSINGVAERTIGTMTTNPAGTANLQKPGFFALTEVGAGSVVIQRDTFDQFVTGFIIETTAEEEDDESEFEAGLVRCSEVNQPAGVVLSCGTDRLTEGKAEIESELGQSEFEVKVLGAEANTSYDVVWRSTDGLAELAIGVLSTDARGNGKLELTGLFAVGTVGAGNVVLKRNGSDQFMTGFKVVVSTKKR